jgi:hypothetical protein
MWLRRSKPPAGCADLDLVEVSGALAKHYGDFTAAARELGVSPPDLRRLTWAKPELLEAAHEVMEEVIARARSELIQAVCSDDPRRQMWAADKILSSRLAQGHLLGPAARQSEQSAQITVRWEPSSAR